MATVYRKEDRIKLKVDDLIVTIRPLSIHEKASVEELVSKGGSSNAVKGALEAVRYAVTNVEGLEDPDGNEYELKKDENDNLSEEAVDDLFNLELGYKLISVCLNLVNAVPKDFYDPNTGKPIEGVSVIKEGDAKRKKSRRASGK